MHVVIYLTIHVVIYVVIHVAIHLPCMWSFI